MQSAVYLDNSSTTKPCLQSVEAVRRALTENWGNPSSLHIMGMEAETAVNNARRAVAAQLRCDVKEIVFTSSGTEANNTAIFGAALKNGKACKRIVTTAIEHPSVLEAVKSLESRGFEIVLLHPDSNGVIPLQAVEAAVNEETALFSMMLVNNETGAIQPVKQAAEIVRKKSPRAIIHCDAVQAFGKLPFTAQGLGVDLISASGHKIHAPKGIGFLYIKKDVHIPPLLIGGGQERGMRSSTESVPLICGLGAAVQALPNLNEQLAKQKQLWDYAVEKITACADVQINSCQDGLPYVLNISVKGYRSETLLHFLESKNIFVSSGSACAKGEGSYVLREMGLNNRLADSALRISFSRENTKQDVDCLAEALQQAVKKLRKV